MSLRRPGRWWAAAAASTAGLGAAVAWAFRRPAFGYEEGAPPSTEVVPPPKLPVVDAVLLPAPQVPPPVNRNYPVMLRVNMFCDVSDDKLTNAYKYKFWRFQGFVPGPMIRARVGDVLDFTLENRDDSGMPHNVDFHAVTGPGGGAAVTLAESLQKRHARFKLLNPGLYVYHCAAAPVPMHIANGMYGLILVEPEKGLEPVDKEYYVMQSEFYFDPPEDESGNSQVAEYSYQAGLREQPSAVVFNGREGALTQDQMLKARVGERVRIFFGNGGPNLVSSFHIIGAIFDKVYREGDLISPPARHLQTTLVPSGGAAVVEFVPKVPGNLTLVDHSIFRMDKGAVGFVSVQGDKAPDIYHSAEPPMPCPNCKLHP